MTSWVNKQKELQQYATSLNKHAKLLTKDNWLSKVLGIILQIISFGKYKQEDFLTGAATSIGNYLFFPKEWNDFQVRSVLPHECRHIFQAQVCGFGIHPLIGLPIMFLIYCLFLFPVLLSFGRFYMEFDADRAKYYEMIDRATNKTDILPYIVKHMSRRIESLCGAMYLWCVPRKVATWFYDKLFLQLSSYIEKI